jgi:uncharacterized membrane protein required for colicin V production
MGLDLLVVTPIIIALLLGFRDGTVRKLVSVLMAILSMNLAKIYMGDVGKVLMEKVQIESADAPTLGFLTIFFTLMLMQSLLYRLLARNYKIGGMVDRILGSAVGFVQGVIVVAAVAYALQLQGFPSQKTVRDARLYTPVASVGPMILRIADVLAPAIDQHLRELTQPSQPSMPGAAGRPQPH